MKKDVISKIAEVSDSLSKGQKHIAQYILENYDKAAFMTASKLGNIVGVSESTVVRFAADLGYDGYPAMRKALQEVIKNKLTWVQRVEVSKDLVKSEDALTGVMSSDAERVRFTFEELDRSEFRRAIEAITAAKNIYIVGSRSSTVLAQYMSFYLNYIFPNVHVINEISASDVFEQIMRISDGDLLVALSFPRYSTRTIRAIQFAIDKGAQILGITDSPESPVAGISHIKLYARTGMLSFVDSLVAPLSLINAIIVETAANCNEDLTDHFAGLEKVWASYNVYEKNNG